MTTTASPIPQSERAIIVDIVRGFAMIGVLIANFTSFSEQNLPSNIFDSISSPIDKKLSEINTIFFEWKFMTLFSILFGYGFGLILASLEKMNIKPDLFFIRRMLWLFFIGLVHTLFWWGDVLHFYAISGVLLLLFKKLSASNILLCSLLCMFIIPPLVSFLLQDQPNYFTDKNIQLLFEQYKHGNIIDVFRNNFNLYYKAFIATGSDLHDIVETLGRFLFGYYLLRIKLFNSIETKNYLFRRILFISIPLTVIYFIIRWLSLHEVLDANKFYWEILIKIGIISTSCFYASILILSFITYGQTKFFSALQALGKMTLTNYLLVSLFSIILLYGIGFGKLGIFSMHTIWVMAFVWLIIEVIFSTYWLNKFKFGPAEWIWRQLTYKKRIPLRK